MVQQWLMPQLQKDSDSFVFQQDGAPAHYGLAVREYLNEDLPQRWIGRTGGRTTRLFFVGPTVTGLNAL
jgi:hypothetical protein